MNTSTVRYIVNNGSLFSLCLRLLAMIVIIVGVVWQSAHLVFRADPINQLRYADALYVSGQYYDAIGVYRELTDRSPAFTRALIRRGMVETVRGEGIRASRTFAQALSLGLIGLEHDLARLYQGRASIINGHPSEAVGFWRTITAESPLFSYKQVLEAESLLHSGDYAGAELTYRQALTGQLPYDWRVLAHSRLAALRASSDIVGARAELVKITGERQQNALPFPHTLVVPLLPSLAPHPQVLADVLDADPAQRSQLLGQLYLDSGLYALAEAQFQATPAGSDGAVAASTYAAYTRILLGDRVGGLQRLEALVDAYPDEPRARALLALVYLEETDAQRAKAQLDAVRVLAPRAPDTHLAWGQWYAAQHDYLAAANEYRRALNDAPAGERGRYALALARFHLDTTVRACEDGRPAAEEAVLLLPNDAAAWLALAQARLVCGEYRGAQAAATEVIARDASSSEAYFYLGQALARLDDRQGAREALVAAADLSPASDWRVKAENQLYALGL